MSSITTDQMISVFKALANNDRLEITYLIKREGEMYAQQVEHRFFLEQSTVSFHLGHLLRAGILSVRKEGRNRLYRISADLNKILEDIESKLL